MTNQDMDCKQAARALDSLFQASGVATKVGAPKYSDSPGFMGKELWPHFSYDVTFTKGKSKIVIDWHCGADRDEIFGGKTLLERPKTPKKGKRPNPSEVFARVCEEAIEARQYSFEEWAGNFGYDTDSRKAEKIYNFCALRYHEVKKFIDDATMQKYADLCRML